MSGALDLDVNEVMEVIRKAFKGVSRGSGISLHQAAAIDDYCTKEEQAEARLLDADTCWEEVPDEWIEKSPSALSFLDSAGFRYYIPAYMMYALRNRHFDGCVTGEFAVYSLAVDAPGCPGEFKESKWKDLDGDQRKAIAAFLRFTANQKNSMCGEHAQQALNDYWASM